MDGGGGSTRIYLNDVLIMGAGGGRGTNGDSSSSSTIGGGEGGTVEGVSCYFNTEYCTETTSEGSTQNASAGNGKVSLTLNTYSN